MQSVPSAPDPDPSCSTPSPDSPDTLTPSQQRALSQILSTPNRVTTLGGYAGTGKSFLIRKLLEQQHSTVLAPTGKAAHVLRRKGVPAATCHSFLYKVENPFAKKPVFIRRDPAEFSHISHVVVDEASMVSTDLYNDLLAVLRSDAKVLFVGDHGQLEPVGPNPNLMLKPDIVLEEILRQALNSPILSFAHKLRQRIQPGATGFPVRRDSIAKLFPLFMPDDPLVICAFNATRVSLNAAIRKARGLTDLLCIGDRVIVTRNNEPLGVFNGLILTVTAVHSCDPDLFHFDGTADGIDYPDLYFSLKPNFYFRDCPYPDRLVKADYGWAITCHKAQGSEAPFVVVVDEPSTLWDHARWRYTAATRASTRLEWILRA